MLRFALGGYFLQITQKEKELKKKKKALCGILQNALDPKSTK